MQLPVTITAAARNEIRNIIDSKRLDPSFYLRIGVKGSGCSGTGYVIGFDVPNDSDRIYHHEGIKILIDKKHFLYLAGVIIDFVDENNQRGFSFSIQ